MISIKIKIRKVFDETMKYYLKKYNEKMYAVARTLLT